MKWLTDSALEKRIRRALKKFDFGFTNPATAIRSSRKEDGGVRGQLDGDERWFPSLANLHDFVAYLEG